MIVRCPVCGKRIHGDADATREITRWRARPHRNPQTGAACAGAGRPAAPHNARSDPERATSPLRHTQEGRVSAVYRAIVDYKRQHDGNSPTIRQLTELCAIPSVNTTHKLLLTLEERGLINLSKRKGDTRSIIVTGGRWLPPEAEGENP